MVCLFCQKETNDGISIHGASELATNARNIIAKYFWFDVSFEFSSTLFTFYACLLYLSFVYTSQAHEINSAEKYACSNCWPKVEAFHEFYSMVEANYRSGLNEIDSKAAFNPLFDCEPEIIVDESICVKTEIDRLDPCTPTDFGTIYIPSTSEWVDDSDRQSEANSTCRKRMESRQKSKLGTRRKKAANAEPTPSESRKQAIFRHAWQLPANVDKIM